MFGINSMELVGQIVEGWTNDLLGREKELSEKRMAICKNCPIYNPAKDRCDSKRGINKKTGELVNIPGPDVVMGCGCIMSKATKAVKKKCVRGLW